MRVFRSFRSVVLCSAVISVLGSLTGLLCALLLSTPTGASVAVVHIVIFLLFTVLGKLRRG
jgi:zinc transport system permease protein